MTTNTAVTKVKIEKTNSERFTDMVVKEFTGTAGELALTSFQKRLVQNYFISIDQSLRLAEEKRLKKSENFRDSMEISWKNVNMELLAVNVVACARIGFDPAQSNHINMIPFKNSALNKLDIVFIQGYRGKELLAVKYGLDTPIDIVVELVFSTDKFQQFKKDKNNPIETYIFEVTNNFERGDLVGGFYYHNWIDKPERNKLMVFSKADIEKRKPKYASAEFWGGEKDKWEKDDKGKSKKSGTEKVEGWYNEMAWKTIFRAAYSAITIDSQKIDDNFIKLSVNEKLAGDLIDYPESQVRNFANSDTLDIETEYVDDEKQKSISEDPKKEPEM